MWSLWWLSAGPSTDKPCQWQSNLTCPRCAFFFMAISWFSSLWWSLYGYPIILICFNVSIKAKVTTGLYGGLWLISSSLHMPTIMLSTHYLLQEWYIRVLFEIPPPPPTHTPKFLSEIYIKYLGLASWRQYVYSVIKID